MSVDDEALCSSVSFNLEFSVTYDRNSLIAQRLERRLSPNKYLLSSINPYPDIVHTERKIVPK